MIDLLFSKFYAATLSMTGNGGLLIETSREPVLAWGIVFCVLAAAALAAWLFRIARPFALGALIISLLIPTLVMPSVRNEWIHVHPERLTVQSGPWFWPTRHEIDLVSLAEIRQQDQQFALGGKLVEPNAVWTFSWQNGDRRRLVLNGFFTTHRLAVAQYLRDRGMIVCDLPSGGADSTPWSC